MDKGDNIKFLSLIVSSLMWKKKKPKKYYAYLIQKHDCYEFKCTYQHVLNLSAFGKNDWEIVRPFFLIF